MDRGDGGIGHRLRHGAAAEPGALLWVRLGENGKLHRRIVKAGELQLCINRGALAMIGGESLGVGGQEILADGFAFAGVFDKHKAPGLAEADRRREAGKPEEALDAAWGKRARQKMPDIAPPNQKLGEFRPEAFVEIWSPRRHRQGLCSC